MATKKAGGSSRNGRDSSGKRLGIKIYDNQVVFSGNIIIRQKGTKYYPGNNTYISKDHTIHAKKDGKIEYRYRKKKITVNVK